MTTTTTKYANPRTIEASEFPAKCLNLMDEVAESGGAIIIAKHGKPVAKLTAFRGQSNSFFKNDAERYSFINEVSDMLDRGVKADVIWEAELGLIDGE